MALGRLLLYNRGTTMQDRDPIPESEGGGPSWREELLNARLWWRQIRIAAGLLSWLRPQVREGLDAEEASLLAARAFPLIGAALGLGAGLVYALAFALGLAPLVAALLGIGALILATGARPERDLSGIAESLAAPAASRAEASAPAEGPLGAVGVIALLLALGARVGTVADLREPGLVIAAMVTAGALSRAAIPAAARYLRAPDTEEEGEARLPGAADVYTGIGLAVALSLIAVASSGLLASLAAAAGAFALATFGRRRRLDRRRLLGTVQQFSEVACLIALAAVR